jgi:uncharacterized protein YggE
MRYLIGFFIIFGLLIHPAFAKDSTITTAGVGKVYETPDMAYLQFGYSIVKKTASEAQKDTAIAIDKLLKAFYKIGIKKEDLKTISFSINERRKYVQNTHKVIGYQCQNILQLKIKGTNDIGKYIDTAVSAGANVIRGINFGFEKEEALKQQALKLAYKDAEEKAESLARAARGKIVGIEEIIEGETYLPKVERFALAEKADTQILPGKMALSAKVRVKFLMK